MNSQKNSNSRFLKFLEKISSSDPSRISFRQLLLDLYNYCQSDDNSDVGDIFGPPPFGLEHILEETGWTVDFMTAISMFEQTDLTVSMLPINPIIN